MSKKNVSKVVSSAVNPVSEAVASVAILTPPPEVGAPIAPTDVAAAPGPWRNPAPSAAILALLPAALIEAQASTFAADFGPNAPSASQLASALDIASRWSQEARRSKAWDGFVRSQTKLGWGQAQLLLGELKIAYGHAVWRNPKIATRYRALAQVLGAAEARAKRAAVTRKNKKRELEKQKENEASPATAATSDPTKVA